MRTYRYLGVTIILVCGLLLAVAGIGLAYLFTKESAETEEIVVGSIVLTVFALFAILLMYCTYRQRVELTDTGIRIYNWQNRLLLIAQWDDITGYRTSNVYHDEDEPKEWGPISHPKIGEEILLIAPGQRAVISSRISGWAPLVIELERRLAHLRNPGDRRPTLDPT